MSSSGPPPSTVITPTDHGAYITITAACGMTFVLLSLLIRIYARAAINGPWSQDDTLLAASTLACVSQSIAKMVSVSHGLGKSIHLINPTELLAVEKSDFVSDIFYIFTLYLAKSSGVFLYLRLTPNKYHVRFCWAIFGASTLWALASILAVVIRCHGSTPWIMDEQCNNMFLRWQIIGAFDVVTEAALFGMAIFLVQGLRMPLRLKVFVVGAFAIRLPVVVFIILRLHYLHPALASADPTFNAVLASIWMEVEVDYCLLACTIPCLKPFMVACNTGWGHVSPQTGDGSYALKSGSYGGSYGLRSLEKTGAKTTITSHRDLKDINGKRHRETTGHNSIDAGRKSHGQELHPDQVGDETTQSIVSNDSTQMIIRREVGWTVTYDDDTTPSTEHPSVHGPQTVRSDIEAQPRMHAV